MKALLQALLKNLIRIGVVSYVNPENMKARVIFEDRDIVSPELSILTLGSLGNKTYHIPQINEQVLCLFLPTGNQKGFIIGSIYNENDKPTVNSESKVRYDFSDGTFVEYDTKESVLTVNAVGTVVVKGEKIFMN